MESGNNLEKMKKDPFELVSHYKGDNLKFISFLNNFFKV